MARDQTHVQPNTYKAYLSTEVEDQFKKSYPGAYSAADMYAMLILPGNQTRALGTLAALSISTHRDTFPVTAMPYVAPRGFTQGHRVVAGTMMFHTIDRNAFGYPNEHSANRFLQSFRDEEHVDEFFLFDVLVTYVNDIGMISFEQLIGVRILDFGKTLSLENLHPIESYSYMALDYQPMKPIESGDRGERNFVFNRSIDRGNQPLRDHEGRVVTSHNKLIKDRTKQ